jgi:site-specific recombinase XerD
MKIKRYSEQTVRTYTGILKIFFERNHGKNPREINHSDIERFNAGYILGRKYSASYQNQFINALKLYYKWNRSGHIIPENLERPNKPRQLPVVLSKDEISRILYHTKNLKHKTALSLIYACGLRVSEAINLRINDIDSSRMIIHIKSGKGDKDRMIGMSPKLLNLLRSYYIQYKPGKYLFEGQGNPKYSARSIEKILKKSCNQAGILKRVTVHTLRHSFATHLVEGGTDVTHVQKLLGHSNIKTTLVYLHISRQFYTNITSPFESLNINP